jgi:hypothetical protein
MGYTVRVNISGPGQAFDDVILAVAEALESRGHTVEIHNDYPGAHATLAEFDAARAQWDADFKRLCEEKGKDYHLTHARTPAHVKISTEHCPWGG